jgi:hypothetical protein
MDGNIAQDVDLQVRWELEELIYLHHTAADIMHKQGNKRKHALHCMIANKFAGLLKASGGYVPRDWSKWNRR